MGTLLFVITLIFEMALAVFSIVTKQHHKKMRSWVRITFFITFVILTLTSIIEWGFRWDMLAIVLFLQASIGTVSLVRNKADKRTYKTSRIIGKAILMTVIFVFAFTPAIVFPQHKEPKVTGQYKVATANFTYTDQNRVEEFSENGEKRFVNVEFWYPEATDGKYPLVVFSHGANGIKASNSSTFKELASHGYVVCSIDHPYHSLFTKSDKGAITTVNSEYMNEVSNSNKEGIYTKEQEYGLIQKWMKLRTDDMNFVIDTILEKTKTEKSTVYQYINTEKIGVFGHSMGGAASVGIGSTRDDVSAVVNLDAPFFTELVYDKKKNDFAASGKSYTTPILNIYTDDVWKQLDRNSTYAANKAAKQNCKEAYTVYFKGAKHLSLTDLSLVSPVLANALQGGKATIDKYYCLETENKLILQFFDYTLKGKEQFTSKETY